MRTIKSFFLILLFFLIMILDSFGQQRTDMSSADVIINFPDVHVTKSFHRATSKKSGNLDLKWRLYPNPATEVLVLERQDSNTDDLELSIFDANGQLKTTQIWSGKKLSIDIMSLDSGNYYLRLNDRNGRRQSISFIKTGM